MWEGLSAFEHAQCTLLARGLPLLKSSLPCSLSPLSLCFGSQSRVLFFFHFAFVFLRSSFERMPPRCSRRAHTWAATIASLTAPMAVPSSTGTVPVSASTVPMSVSTVLSSSGSVASASAVRGERCGRPPVVLSAPRDKPTPPSSGDFVPSRDGVLALIRGELRTLESQFMPENPLQPVPYVAGGSQSGELFTPVGWARVFDGCVAFLVCCGPCVLANWAICQLCRHGCFTPIFWLRPACTLVTVFVCWFAHVFHVCVGLSMFFIFYCAHLDGIVVHAHANCYGSCHSFHVHCLTLLIIWRRLTVSCTGGWLLSCYYY